MRILVCSALLVALPVSFGMGWVLSGRAAVGEESGIKGWTKGKGWGPWGNDDEIGSLNAMTSASIKKALGLVKEGKVYDLGVPYDSESYKWPGHSPATILTFRGPEGVRRQGDFKAALDPKLNPDKIAWHSCALFINDNVGTQIDSLGHIALR
jgi:hypothetical protein